METKVSRGAIFGVHMEFDDAQLKRMKKAPEPCDLTMQDVAFFWHTGILPQHFERSAHDKYGFAPRAGKYPARKGGAPDMVKTGAMKAELLARAAVRKKGKAGGVVLKLQARAMNFVPSSTNMLDRIVKRNDGKNYPNMRREVAVITDQEDKQLVNIAQTRLAALFSGAE